MIRFDDVIIKIGDFQLNANMTIPKGFIAVIGQSGAGKSTFLSSLSGHQDIDSGKILINDTRIDQVPPNQRPCSVIFQEFNLFSHLSIAQNLNLVCGNHFFVSEVARKKIQEVLEKVGIQNKYYKRPHELSGGEQQRVAIARALLNDPELILADEPTGNLDGETGAKIMDLLFELQRDNGTTMVLISHDKELADRCGRTITLADGKIKE